MEEKKYKSDSFYRVASQLLIDENKELDKKMSSGAILTKCDKERMEVLANIICELESIGEDNITTCCICSATRSRKDLNEYDSHLFCEYCYKNFLDI